MELVTGVGTDEWGVKTKTWFDEQIGYKTQMLFTYITWVENGKIVATAMYEGYKKGSIELHFLTKTPLTRAILRDIFYYPFDSLGVNVVFIKFPRYNTKSLTTVAKVGFKYVATIPEFFGPGKKNDGLIFTINKEKSLKWRQYERLSTSPAT